MPGDDHTVSLGDWDARRPRDARTAAVLPDAGDTVDHYLVLSLVATGGMGAVLAAWDARLDRRVALKLLLPERGTADAVARLHREAQAMARLNHPNVATVHDVGEIRGRPYVAMEFVEGVDLAHWLERDDRDWRATVAVFLAAGEGLAAAHRAGIVHRDFKPSNVMVGDDGRVRVTDFGLARALAETSSEADDSSPAGAESRPPGITDGDRSSPLETDLTRAGSVLGTPAYMAPEQVLEGHADARTDQFAFCVALYEALYGVHPFADARNPAELASRTIRGVAPPPADAPPVPARIWEVLVRGLSADPADRFPDVPALLDALRDDPVRRRRRRWIAATAAVVIVAVAAGAGVRHLAVVRSCARGPELAAAVLTEPRRGRVADRFAAVAPAAGEVAAAASLSVVDRWLAEWGEVRNRCCRATRLDHERSPTLLDHEIACLDRGLATADALLSMMETADPTLVATAHEAVAGLPSPEECWEAVGLAGLPALPSAPTARAALDEAESLLAEADALHLAGRFDERLEVTVRAVEAADASGYLPAAATARVDRGIAEADLARDDESRESLVDGLSIAERAGDDAGAARAAIHLVWLDGALAARFDEADRWRRIAAAKVERLGGDPRLEAELTATSAAAFREQGEYGRALDEQRRHLELITALEGPDSLLTARAHHALGLVLAELGEHDAALAQLDSALELKSHHLGANHPGLAASLVSRADVLTSLGRSDEAVADAERGLAILEAVLGPRHPELGTALNNLAVAYEEAGRLDDAEAIHERGLDLIRSVHGPDHVQIGYTSLNLAILRYQKGDPAGAVAPAAEAARVLTATLGGDHPHVAFAENNVGMFLMYADRPSEAVPHLETALAIRAAAAADPVLVEQTRFNLARAAWKAGERSRATTLARRARAALVALGDDGEDVLGRVEEWLRAPPE